MPKPVFLMTVHEAHMEYNSLIDQIQAKYELLDSGECGSVGTPAFNAECSELAHLMARMSKPCNHEPANAQGTSQAPTLQALKCSKFYLTSRKYVQLAGRPFLLGSQGKGFPSFLNGQKESYPFIIYANENSVKDSTTPEDCAHLLK